MPLLFCMAECNCRNEEKLIAIFFPFQRFISGIYHIYARYKALKKKKSYLAHVHAGVMARKQVYDKT